MNETETSWEEYFSTLSDEDYNQGYGDGFIDGKKAGFEEAIAWLKGKL